LGNKAKILSIKGRHIATTTEKSFPSLEGHLATTKRESSPLKEGLMATILPKEEEQHALSLSPKVV